MLLYINGYKNNKLFSTSVTWHWETGKYFHKNTIDLKQTIQLYSAIRYQRVFSVFDAWTLMPTAKIPLDLKHTLD